MRTFLFSFALFALIFTTTPSAHAAPLEVSGWIPYWVDTAGMKDAAKHFDVLTSVYPFSFSVAKTGGLKDLAGMDSSSWERFVEDAKDAGVEVIPTVMWSDTTAIHSVLSDSRLRAAHIEAIVDMVSEGGYDGVDIDYEGKKASTRPYFSLFLKELKSELGRAELSCTIEARTPPDSLYRTVPATIEYANDLKEIGRHCDRVNAMTYDQQRADLKLNEARKGTPYYPLADPDWVEKVAKQMERDIPARKLMLGVGTYGREVAVKVSPQWFESYTSVRSVNPGDATKTAKKFKVKPSENKAGEQSFTYLPKNSKVKLRDLPDAPRGTSSGDEVALRALEYANKTGKSLTVNMVWWSDADAIADKVELAKERGLRGVSIFKIDGAEDSGVWRLF